MKIREGFELRQVGDENIVITIGDAVACFNGMIRLNRKGAYLWGKMIQDIGPEQLICDFANEHKLDMDLAVKEVKSFLNSINSTGCVIGVDSEELRIEGYMMGPESPKADIIDFDDDDILAISFSYKDNG